MKSVILWSSAFPFGKISSARKFLTGFSQLIILVLLAQSTYSQGISCGTAFLLNLNGNITNYNTATSTGTAVVCTAYTGTTPVTWFRFVTNAAAECPLLNITASDGQPCEVALYSTCNGQNLQATSSMCFADGTGLWAPNETYVISASTTYYLRIKTSTACTISIGGQFINPTNSNCLGASSITTAPISDNNSCHKGSTEVLPDQLCAFTLENTAFYKFIIASPGSAIMNISDISCDNGEGNNASGFQIGFFTGSCGALTPLNCENGSGSFVQATTNPLPAGSLVFVAIDGVSGSNCKYTLTGINVYGVLAENFKNFSGWKKTYSNVLTWSCIDDNGKSYIMERSANGKDFIPIGQLARKYSGTKETSYEFEDKHPVRNAWYRVRQIDLNNAISLSQAVRISRIETNHFEVRVVYAFGNLNLEISSQKDGQMLCTIMDNSGLKVREKQVSFTSGVSTISIDTGNLPSGTYFITMRRNNEEPITKTFIRLF